MKENFNQCLKQMLVHEGGFSNNPADPGGMTNLGVTARVWEEWTGHPATEEIMRKLKPEDVEPLYRKKYWDAAQGDLLPSGVDNIVFDTAVNMGVGRAIKLLQEAAGVPADGHIGQITMQEIWHINAKDLIGKFADLREAFYRSLATFPTFGKGWIARVEQVEDQSKEFVA